MQAAPALTFNLLRPIPTYATSICFSSNCLFQPIIDVFDPERGRIGRALLGGSALTMPDVLYYPEQESVSPSKHLVFLRIVSGLALYEPALHNFGSLRFQVPSNCI